MDGRAYKITNISPAMRSSVSFDAKSMLRHNTFTLRSAMKNIEHEYLRILIKTVEINEKKGKNHGGVLTSLIISQLLSALEYQTWF